MFYPVDSLKRGGRFYLCWIADSWPLRFSAITHRQLWSQDIRQICDDLMVVVINESGRPNHRFSLRLSSQLMRGLVRLYERKATVLVSDLCMFNANVFKHTHKKSFVRDVNARTARRLPQVPAAAVVQEEPVTEQRLEELIQNSGNVVGNIQDITLKEAVIPEFRLPPNDNFGEENPDQPIQAILADRTMELMMQETSGAQVSGLDLPQDHSIDKSADKSRRQIGQHQMEGIAEVDTPFKKSIAGDILPAFEKEIPAVPEVPPPVIPVPETIPPQIQEPVIEMVQEQEIPIVEEPRKETAQEEQQQKEKDQEKEQSLELEELEQQPAHRKRRARTSLIIDKRIKLSSEFLRARIENPRVEMRVEGDFMDAIISIRVPVDMLFHRPTCGARGFHSNISPLLGRLYRRNLGPAHGVPLADREQEQEKETEQPRERRARSSVTLEKIPEVEETPAQASLSVTHAQGDMTRITVGEGMIDVTAPNITAEVLSSTLNVTAADALNVVGEVPTVEVQDPQMQVDIADLPTQKLETLTQEARKRASDQHEDSTVAKRTRSSGSVSHREKQKRTLQPPEIIITEAPEQADKENIPPNNVPQQVPREVLVPLSPLQQSQADAARMLIEAGLSELPPPEPSAPEVPRSEIQARKPTGGSDSSETPLGSLDRTKVSLGDSIRTTDEQRFIRNEWGIEGTMMKIIAAVKAGGPVTVGKLVAGGPLLPTRVNIIAARCFTSVLKLKQHGFIRIVKNPETLEILDMFLGPRFDNI